MARTVSKDSLEHKIEKAQTEVDKYKAQYDAALAVLKDLQNKRDALQKEEVVKAIMKSGRSYEEILAFLNSDE